MSTRRSFRTAHSRETRVPSAWLTRLQTILEGYRGAARTILARDLANILGISDPTGRTIRQCVNALIDAGTPVGSLNLETGGGGYFLVTNEFELARCVRNYQSRARENLKKAERLTAAFRHGPRQAALRLDDR